MIYDLLNNEKIEVRGQWVYVRPFSDLNHTSSELSFCLSGSKGFENCFKVPYNPAEIRRKYVDINGLLFWLLRIRRKRMWQMIRITVGCAGGTTPAWSSLGWTRTQCTPRCRSTPRARWGSPRSSPPSWTPWWTATVSSSSARSRTPSGAASISSRASPGRLPSSICSRGKSEGGKKTLLCIKYYLLLITDLNTW